MKNHSITINADGAVIDGNFHDFKTIGKLIYCMAENDKKTAEVLEEVLMGIDECMKAEDVYLSYMQATLHS